MQLGESKERYLEAIYCLSKRQGMVLSVDIARYLNFSKPSVSIALKELCRLGLIEFGAHYSVLLTEEGKQYAKQLHERVGFFYDVLTAIGMEDDSAKEDANRLTYVISDEAYSKLNSYYNRLVMYRYNSQRSDCKC